MVSDVRSIPLEFYQLYPCLNVSKIHICRHFLWVCIHTTSCLLEIMILFKEQEVLPHPHFQNWTHDLISRCHLTRHQVRDRKPTAVGAGKCSSLKQKTRHWALCTFSSLLRIILTKILSLFLLLHLYHKPPQHFILSLFGFYEAHFICSSILLWNSCPTLRMTSCVPTPQHSGTL